MADFPSARLRLYQPPFWSTGVDCFGPFTVKIGRRHEKRWGIIFKCLTTRCIHLDLLHSMDSDSFLMALRRFVARRGKPFELISDQGTNFRGGNRELQETFSALEPAIKEKRLGYVCNPRSLKEGTETSRRRTDELGYRLERPIHFECKLNEPMHIGMRLLHPAAADHSVSINRQQVQRIFRFSLRSRAGARPLSGGTGAVATGRDVSVPSFRERGLHT